MDAQFWTMAMEGLLQELSLYLEVSYQPWLLSTELHQLLLTATQFKALKAHARAIKPLSIAQTVL